MQKSTLIISRETKHEDKKKTLWQTNLIIAFLSVILLVSYKLMALHCRPREGKTPMDLKEKCYRSSVYKNLCQNNMKITFPTTEMQPPLAWDLPDF